MQLLIGAGAPREAAARALAYLFFVCTEKAARSFLSPRPATRLLSWSWPSPPTLPDRSRTSATGCYGPGNLGKCWFTVSSTLSNRA
jgi:hypothetical protein